MRIRELEGVRRKRIQINILIQLNRPQCLRVPGRSVPANAAADSAHILPEDVQGVAGDLGVVFGVALLTPPTTQLLRAHWLQLDAAEDATGPVEVRETQNILVSI